MTFFKPLLVGSLLVSSSIACAYDSPLKSQTRVNLPASVNSVASAANYFISPHRYKITVIGASPHEALSIAQQRIPATVPKGAVMTVEEALLSLLHRNQVLIIDNHARLISFGLAAKEGVAND
jgi:hypothetical protein